MQFQIMHSSAWGPVGIPCLWHYCAGWPGKRKDKWEKRKLRCCNSALTAAVRTSNVNSFISSEKTWDFPNFLQAHMRCTDNSIFSPNLPVLTKVSKKTKGKPILSILASCSQAQVPSSSSSEGVFPKGYWRIGNQQWRYHILFLIFVSFFPSG